MKSKIVICATVLLALGTTLVSTPAFAADVTVAPSVECDSEFPLGIVVTNPASNVESYFLQSEVSDASGPLFGDGGLLAPGESLRSGSGGGVEDATYSYVVSQSPQVDGSPVPTEPFTQVASGSFVFDCEPNPAPDEGNAATDAGRGASSGLAESGGTNLQMWIPVAGFGFLVLGIAMLARRRSVR